MGLRFDAGDVFSGVDFFINCLGQIYLLCLVLKP